MPGRNGRPIHLMQVINTLDFGGAERMTYKPVYTLHRPQLNRVLKFI